MTLSEIADRYPGGRWHGDTYETHCPCSGHEHGDRNPSLGFSVGRHGGIVVCCQKGHPVQAVLAARGLSLRDIAPPATNGSSAPYGGPGMFAPEAVYRYEDEQGEPLYEKVRLPRGAAQRFFLRLPGSTKGGIGETRRVLYGLPALLATRPGDTVAIVEGEKDADNVRLAGVAATTNPEGAALPGQRPKWRQEYTEWLKQHLPERRFAVFADQDEAGLAHAEAVIASLKAAGLPVFAVPLAGLAAKEDISDWLGRHTTEEFQALLAPAVVPWDAPLDLTPGDLPPFPLDALPGWLRRQVEAVAASLAVPVDACALFALACLAVACQKRMVARIRADWAEPLSLWVLIVLPPANRKSQLFQRLQFPLREYERNLGDTMQAVIAAARAEHRILAGRLKKAEEQAVKGKTEFGRDEASREAVRLAVQLEETVVPAEPRLIVADATPEKLGILLQDSGGRMAVMSPEGDVFEMMAGRYSSGQATLALYLAGHSADDYTVDRVNRPPVRLTGTTITFGLTVQPDVLSGFAAKPQFRGRGLLGRFLYCIPESLLGERPPLTPPVPPEIEEEYRTRLTALLSAAVPEGETHEVSFDLDADAAMIELQDWIEPRLGRWGDLSTMTDWAGKLAGQAARLATLCHLGELAGTPAPWSIPVGGDAVAAGRRIAEYLIPHARTAFAAMGSQPVRENARHLLAWLKRLQIGRFSRRNVHRRLIGTFPRVEDLDAALALLTEHGYVRSAPDDGPRRPGPRSVLFEVHPEIAGEGRELES